MGQAELQPRRYTVEEYMALEAQEDIRREFYEGEIQPLPNGDTTLHNRVLMNVALAFRQTLRGRGYSIFTQSVQLQVVEGRYYCYPDVAVTCDAADSMAERTIASPTVLVEVISEYTTARDRGWKFNQYKQLASLQHYFLVSQTTCLVEWYRRTASGEWAFEPLTRLADEADLSDFGMRLKLSDVYEEIDVQTVGFHFDCGPFD